MVSLLWTYYALYGHKRACDNITFAGYRSDSTLADTQLNYRSVYMGMHRDSVSIVLDLSLWC